MGVKTSKIHYQTRREECPMNERIHRHVDHERRRENSCTRNGTDQRENRINSQGDPCRRQETRTSQTNDRQEDTFEIEASRRGGMFADRSMIDTTDDRTSDTVHN